MNNILNHVKYNSNDLVIINIFIIFVVSKGKEV